MKKLFNRALFLAMGFSAAMALTACHSSSDETPAPTPGPSVVVNDLEREVVVVTNVNPDEVWYNGRKLNTGEYTVIPNSDGTFTIIIHPAGGCATTSNIVIKKNGYDDQTFTVKFAEGEDEVTVRQDLMPTEVKVNLNDGNNGGTIDVTTGKTTGDIVVDNQGGNDKDNSEASMEIDGGTTITNEDGTANDGTGFSITAYIPPTEPDEDLNEEINSVGEGSGQQTSSDKNVEADLSVMAVRCNPDGISFTDDQGNPKEVTIRVSIPGSSDGFKLTCKNGNEETPVSVDNNDRATIKVTHFSDWIFDCEGEMTGIQLEHDPLISGNFTNTTAGKVSKKVNFTKKVGNHVITMPSGLTTASQKLINTYLAAHLGAVTPFGTAARTSSKSTNLAVDAMTRTDYEIYQTYKDITFRFPREKDGVALDPYVGVVRQYGEVKVSRTNTPYTGPVEEHVGGTE